MGIEDIKSGEHYAYDRSTWGSIEEGYEVVEVLGVEDETIHQYGRDVPVKRVRIRFADGREMLTNPKWLFGTVEETEREIARREDQQRAHELESELQQAQQRKTWHDLTEVERKLNEEARALAGRLRALGFELEAAELPDFVADRASRERHDEDGYEACYHAELNTTFKLTAERMLEMVEALESKEARSHTERAS